MSPGVNFPRVPSDLMLHRPCCSTRGTTAQHSKHSRAGRAERGCASDPCTGASWARSLGPLVSRAGKACRAPGGTSHPACTRCSCSAPQTGRSPAPTGSQGSGKRAWRAHRNAAGRMPLETRRRAGQACSGMQKATQHGATHARRRHAAHRELAVVQVVLRCMGGRGCGHLSEIKSRNFSMQLSRAACQGGSA